VGRLGLASSKQECWEYSTVQYTIPQKSIKLVALPTFNGAIAKRIAEKIGWDWYIISSDVTLWLHGNRGEQATARIPAPCIFE
jgi:hypothetical protein